MKTSDNIAKIALALSKAQAEMTGAVKSATNPFFKSNYADLSEVISALSEPFANNELSFVQAPGVHDSRISVTTRIMHSSGEWLECTIELPPTKNDAQGYGSSISYGKRYGLQAMAGLPTVDDDGNDAVKHKAPPKKRVNKSLVQKYVQAFVEAIDTEDSMSMIELGEELKDSPEHAAVWGALDSKQKATVKRLIHEAQQAA